MRLGIISDTHGFCHPRVFELFEGVERIIHAGDIGSEAVLADLEALAPVAAVVGNMDGPPLTGRLPYLLELELEGRLFIVTHQAGPPGKMPQEIEDLIRKRKPAALIFGHTHEPLALNRAGTLYLNPGYCGPASHRWARCLATIALEGGHLEPTIHRLDDPF